MRKTALVSTMTAGLALLVAGGALAAGQNPALNPVPARESKLVVGFETAVEAVSDPDGTGGNLASIDSVLDYVAEGTKSLKLDLNGINSWHDPYFAVDLPEPIDIKGHQVLSMDVYVPEGSLNPDGGWFQFSPRLTTTDAADDSVTSVSYYDNRDLVTGWNRFIWDLRTGTDTKITRIAFAGNTDGARPYTGPIYVDNIRVYKGSFHGIQADEKLIQGFEDKALADLFSGAQTAEINTDKQFVRDGEGSLKIDLTGAEGGWTNDIVRADDWGATIDVSNATAIHLDLFVPEGHQPTGWRQLGFVVIGEGGQLGTAGLGFVPGQWNTLQITLTKEQAQMLSTVKGLYFIRNQDSSTPWNGPVYVDNLRAVVPAQ